jgi:hypothetical protein
MARLHRAWAAILVAAIASGCAATATRPPTPAAHIRADDLDRDPVPPNERYYLLVFGSETKPLRPKFTHTWSTVVKVVDQGSGQPPVVDASTISWMPATLDIHPLRFRVECGVNLDLCTTIREMLKNDEQISLWGPYEVRAGLYKKVLMQKDFMESGAVGYQCIDTIGEARKGVGSDCIHAITDCDADFDRGNYPLRRFGNRASEYIVEQLRTRRLIVNPCVKHDWLLAPLGIADCPIDRK